MKEDAAKSASPVGLTHNYTMNPGSTHPHTAPSPPNSVFKQLVTKMISSFLGELEREETRKSMMDKLVAPTLKLLYTQLMPYLLIIVALILIMLLLVLLTFCMTVVMYFSSKKRV
jgi:hypothetical protein